MPGQCNFYSFGEYTLDLKRGSLLRAGAEVGLRPKSFEVLRLLVERHGQLIAKEEFLATVWGRVVVTEGSLTQCLIEVRRAIGDEAHSIIRTVPRRGYIFEAPVVEVLSEPGHDTGPAEPAVTGTTSPATRAPRLRPRLSLAVAAVVLVAVALSAPATATWWRNGRVAATVGGDLAAPGRATIAQHRFAPPRNSIAVLPFVNMSADPDQAYFSDGISEEILNSLAQSPDLQVIARTSSFAFRDRNTASVTEIAGRLNVAYVLEGSVRKSGDRLRITTQLVKGTDGAHLWSQTYDRDAGNAFDVQSDIAARVSAALKVRLRTESVAASQAHRPGDAAYDAYLRGRFLFGRRQSGDLDRARAYFEQSLSIDPSYAQAWVGLARVYALLPDEGALSEAAAHAKGDQALARAIALDPDLAEAQVEMAWRLFFEGNGIAAARHFRRAYELDPNDPSVLGWLSMRHAARHRYEEWIAVERQRADMDPLSATSRNNLAIFLMCAGHFDEARAEFRKAVELNPDYGPGAEIDLLRILILEGKYTEALAGMRNWPEGEHRDAASAMIYDALGREGDAAAAVRRLVAAATPSAALRLAEFYALRGRKEQAFGWLATAYDRLGPEAWRTRESETLWMLNFSPFLAPLRSDSRWETLAARALAPASRAALADLPDDVG